MKQPDTPIYYLLEQAKSSLFRDSAAPLSFPVIFEELKAEKTLYSGDLLFHISEKNIPYRPLLTTKLPKKVFSFNQNYNSTKDNLRNRTINLDGLEDYLATLGK